MTAILHRLESSPFSAKQYGCDDEVSEWEKSHSKFFHMCNIHPQQPKQVTRGS